MNHQQFDHILIGTGQATGTLVSALPTTESIAIIEGGKIGGTCVNSGCTPTKTLVASAKVAHMARRAHEYGVTTGDVSVDFERVMERMNSVRGSSTQGLESWLRSLPNVSLFQGWAQFVGPKAVRVNGASLEGQRIYINVGGRSRTLAIPGLSEVPWLDHARLLDLKELPKHLIIIGGSYIGLEFAQMFRRFGSEVTVLEASSQIMSREDKDVADEAQQILEDEGITFYLDASVTEVRKGFDETIEVSLDKGTVISGSHVLLAVGRVPNTDRLNLQAAGIETDKRGFIQVDQHVMTNVKDVFALGDVNGQGAFTHTAVNDAEIALDTMRGGDRTLSNRATTYALFTDPPLARAGLTEKQARDQGYRLLKATRAMKRISRAKEMGETQGFVKLLVDADTDQVLGASILGVHGDEVINLFNVLIQAGIPWRQFRKTVLIHPTVSELMPWILDDLKLVETPSSETAVLS
jgi:pyruvate/2-oxoglutarate dehydrogenase complex dihydrolipoamide dehydrogenase (E3) component